MERLSSSIKKMNITSIIFSIIFICIGLFLLINPDSTINFIAYVLGVMLILWGVVLIVQFFRRKEEANFFEANFIVGLLVFILGIVFLIKPKAIASIIPLLLGVWMIASGVIKLGCALSINKQKRSYVSIILSALIVVAGLFLVFNPFEGAEIITRVIGVLMVVYSVLDIVECIFIRQTIKDIESAVTSVVEAEYKEKE